MRSMLSLRGVLAGCLLLLAPGALADGPPLERPVAEPPPSIIQATALGSGPFLVFLHDIGGSRSPWLPIARSLADRHRVVVADLPGHGESLMPGRFSLRIVSGLVGRLLAEQGADTAIVVGQAFGGLVALEYAAMHPHALRGVVLVDVTPGNPFDDTQRAAMVRAMEEYYPEFMRAMFTRMSVDSTRGVRLHAQASLVPPSVMKTYLREALYTDMRTRLKAVDVPVLLIATEKLWSKTETWGAAARRLGYENLPRLQVRRVGNSGHAVAVDQPDSLRLWIEAFADSVLGR